MKSNLSAVEALVKKSLAPYAAELGREVGEVANGLDRDTCLEATMDNFLNNAVREAAGTQLSFSNGWRWGAPIRAGKLTLNDLYNIIPMTVPISTVELSGAELKQLLEDNLTVQAVPEKYNRKRRDLSMNPVDAMQTYLKKNRPARAEIHGTIIAF